MSLIDIELDMFVYHVQGLWDNKYMISIKLFNNYLSSMMTRGLIT